MATGDPSPETCVYCGAVSVYEHDMHADGFVHKEKLCTVCQRVQP